VKLTTQQFVENYNPKKKKRGGHNYFRPSN